MNPSGPKHEPAAQDSLKHPGRWLWLLLAIPIVIGLLRLRFDVEVFDLLPENLAVVKGLKLYQEHFANARELILTLEGKSAEQTEAAAQTIAESLRGRPELVASATWQPPWLEHPDQAAELMAYLWLNQPPSVLREFANRLSPPRLPALFAAARDELTSSMSPQEIGRLSYDPLGFTQLPESMSSAAPAFAEGQELFSSSDGTFRIIFVKANSDLRTYKDCEHWLNTLKRIVADALGQTGGAVQIGYTGRPAFVSEIARGMEHDMTTSVGGTAAIIALLFWLAHRRIKPMLWLLFLLAIILGSTLALGGLAFGAINVVSIGFAAILLGLAVDYAVVHYQEALAQPHLSVPQIRHAIAPSILWAAVTTISAFLVLNFGGLPGLGQLGTLVGLGVALAATIMIFEFLPPLFPKRNQPSFVPLSSASEPSRRTSSPSPANPDRLRAAIVFAITALLLLTALALLLSGLPKLDTSANALRPRRSPAYETVDKIQAHLNRNRDPLWLIIRGRSLEDVGERLDETQAILNRQLSNGLVADFTLPAALWPRPAFQTQNRPTALALVAERATFRQAALTNGFASNSLALAERVLDTFQAAGSTESVFWPTNPMSQWIFEKLVARTPTNYFALGLINPVADAGTKNSAMAELEAGLPHQDTWLSGWRLLGAAILARVQANMWKVVGPMVCLVLLSLYLAFRRAPEILLSVAVLALGGLCVLALMRLAGWSWNLLNLMAIPLVLGTGVDYSIFMQLALRRHEGDLGMAWRSVGRALLLCGGTAIAGFGSLALSSNAGMASLGQVCALGIGSNMLIAIFLLPTWWQATHRRRPSCQGQNPTPERVPETAAPSSLYRSEFWRLGLFIVRLMPAGALAGAATLAGGIYHRLARHRREIVIKNLLPGLDQDQAAAQKVAALLFRQFARKLVDLWRYEARLPIGHLFGETSGWEYFEQAQAQKRGILLVTPHLGNWEFGGPMLTGRGVTLQVITLAEPGEAFTKMRLASRAKWDIQTLVIGNDPLAFLEIIKRLEQGATVALLIDRPPPPTAITVELFGQPFAASIAAAELARASGCTLLPVYVPRKDGKYDAHILPPVPYERATLRDRNARQQLTQRMITAFEPIIRQHLDQWFHFVPVWPKEALVAENKTGVKLERSA